LSASSLLELTAAPACCAGETWKPIPDWPHEASTCGRVRSIDRQDENGVWRLGAILPQHPDKRKGKGYLYVTLRDGKRTRKVHVAVAVLEAHRGLRPFPDWEACHNDGIRTDNHLAGLRWDSREGNRADMLRHRQERAVTQGVTAGAAKRDETGMRRYKTPVFPGIRIPSPSRHPRYRDAADGTGSPPPFLTFSSVPASVQPLVRAVRTSFLTLLRWFR
jgi:NUMOD4 motif